MTNIKINNSDMATVYGMYTAAIEISAPKVKEHTIDVPYRDGTVDISDYYGTKKYKNRKIKIVGLIMKNDEETILESWTAICNAFNGKQVTLEINEDGWKYNGIMHCGTARITKSGRVTMTIDAQPYKTDTNGNKSL